MPVINVHAHKGGQGVTTIAATLALLAARTGRRTLLIDTAGDQPAILGIPTDPTAPGLTDHLHHHTPLDQLTVPVTDRIELLPAGTRPDTPLDTATYGLLTGSLDHYDTVIIDTGAAHAWHRHGDQRILVTRTCYLALRRAVSQHPPTHIVAIDEPGRAIRPDDITAILGIPVTPTIRHDPAIARTIDAGLLTSQLPPQLARGLRHLLDTTTTAEVTR